MHHACVWIYRANGVTISIPIHMRYQSASLDEVYHDVAIHRPLIYLHCDAVHDTNQWHYITYNDQLVDDMLSVQVPVGQLWHGILRYLVVVLIG